MTERRPHDESVENRRPLLSKSPRADPGRCEDTEPGLLARRREEPVEPPPGSPNSPPDSPSCLATCCTVGGVDHDFVVTIHTEVESGIRAGRPQGRRDRHVDRIWFPQASSVHARNPEAPFSRGVIQLCSTAQTANARARRPPPERAPEEIRVRSLCSDLDVRPDRDIYPLAEVKECRLPFQRKPVWLRQRVELDLGLGLGLLEVDFARLRRHSEGVF